MVLGHPEIFICSDTNPLFQRIVNLDLRPDDFVPFPTTHLESIHIESRPMAVRIRMENYMRQQGYSDEEIQRVTYPRSQSERGSLCSYSQRQIARARFVERARARARERTERGSLCIHGRRIQRARESAMEYYIRNRERAREREANPEEIIWNQFSTIQLHN